MRVWLGWAAFFAAAVVAAGCAGGGQPPGTGIPQNASFAATASEPMTVSGLRTTVQLPSSGGYSGSATFGVEGAGPQPNPSAGTTASPVATATAVPTASVYYGSSPPAGVNPFSVPTTYQTIAYVCITTPTPYSAGYGSTFQFTFPSIVAVNNPAYLLAIMIYTNSWGLGYGRGSATVSGTTTTVTAGGALGVMNVQFSQTPTCFVLYAQPSTVPLPPPIP